LDKIQLGDKVYVENEKGDTLVFVVREMHVYGAREIVPEVWNKNDAAHLNLITCSGDWNASTGTSDKRLVVFTDLAT
jgi:sortase (surface protein transpeptidase)